MNNRELYTYVKLKNGGGGSIDEYKDILIGVLSDTLIELVVPDGTTKIRTYGFYRNENLVSLKIPSSVEVIDSYAFNSCLNLKTVEIAHGVKNVKLAAFGSCVALETISLPSTLVELGSGMFNYCYKLNNVILENGFNCNGLDLRDRGITQSSIVNMINALADRTGETPYALYLGSANLGKITNEEKAIATNKNWVLA